MGDLSKLLEVIGLFYDSVIDEVKWPKALESLADFAGGCGAFHIIANPTTGVITRSESVGVDPIINQHYLQYYAAKEVRLAPALPYPVGQPLTESNLVDERTLKRSEIYGELLSPFDVPHVMFAWLQKKEQAFQTIVIEGSSSHGAFQQQARERFSRVMPHLVRAARMRELLVSARESLRACSQVLETLPFGVVLLDETGHAIHVTRSAECLLQGKHGLVQNRGRVSAWHRVDDRCLQQAVQNSVRSTLDRSVPGHTIIVRSADGHKRVTVTVIPVSSRELFLTTPQPAGLMLIVDPEQALLPRAALIQRALRLTRAEAVLANALLEGTSLRDVAETLGRSINTCKTQLKSIYSKTGCRNQVDLAKLLMLTALARAGFGTIT